MKLKNFNIIILIIVLAFISCEKDEHKIKNVTNDIQLLNDKIIIDEALNISYQIPINWNEMPASLSKKFVARLSGKDKNNLIVYSPKSFYYDENSSSLLRVGRVGLKDKLTSGVLTLEKYIELFKKYNSDLIIERNEIHLNQLEIIELKIEKGNLISFKIIFHNRVKEIIQLDFSIMKENIAKLKPSINASIKSIKLL